ncbi:MAG: DUF488 domain-containing protein [Cyanobacteria bacterium P01_F01_bin.150]
MPRPIFTIGHSNHTIDEFIGLLKHHGVTALADVRSHPYSRYCQHFCKAPLEGAIRKAGLSYVFLGKELGPRSTDPDCYIDGTVSYERLAQTPIFIEGLNRLVKGSETHSIALMCAEHDPITCHRAILVSRPLHTDGHTIQHILRNGRLESHSELEDRLLKLYTPDQPEPEPEEAIAQLDLLSVFGTKARPTPSSTFEENNRKRDSSITVVRQLDVFKDWLEPQLEKRQRAIAIAYCQQGKKIAYRK